MWTTVECYAPNATADEATDDTGKEEHATTRKTKTNETDYPSLSCPPNTPTHGESPTAIPTKEKAGRRKTEKKRRQSNKRTDNTVVFGDNVRARKAARALPRTPTHKRKRKREDKRREPPPRTTVLLPNTNHHRHPTMTQPCHKDTTLNQQWCDNKHTQGWDDTRGEQDNASASPNPNTGHHTHTTPAIQHGHHANGRGAPTRRRGGQRHCRPSITMPPHHHNATPPSTTAPPTTTARGE